jgi:hypothetical protein
MKYRIAAWVVLGATAGLGLASPGDAKRAKVPQARKFLQEKKAKAPASQVDVNKLALEVMALKGLQEFDPSLEQLKGLQEMYKAAFVSRRKLPEGKASKNYVNNLKKLRDAYLENDEDDIEEYTNKVDVLAEEEEPVVVDEIRPSLAAAVAAGEALRLFSAKQVLEVLNAYDDDLPGPASTLLEALEDGVDSKGPEWEKERNDAAYKASWLGFGLANNRQKRAREEAVKWLDEKHALKEAELTRQRSKLEKEVREKLFERANPATVIMHIAVHDMAVILANPELPQVLAKRIKRETDRLKADKK